VYYFLESGSFSANVQDNDGRTALHISSAHGHVTITRLLLAHGAHPNAKTVDGTRSVTYFIACHVTSSDTMFMSTYLCELIIMYDRLSQIHLLD